MLSALLEVVETIPENMQHPVIQRLCFEKKFDFFNCLEIVDKNIKTCLIRDCKKINYTIDVQILLQIATIENGPTRSVCPVFDRCKML
jgi:hypothetical protein